MAILIVALVLMHPHSVHPQGVLSDPKFAEALKAYEAALDDPAARASLDAVLAAHPDDPMGLIAVGQEFVQRRDYRRALEFLSIATTRFPKNPKPHYFTGICCFVLEKYDQSEASLRIALELGGEDPEVVYNLAQALGQQRKIDEAERLYKRAVELAPERSLFHFSLGEALMHVTKIDDAIVEFQKAAELGKARKRQEDVPSRGRALYNIGKLLGMQGKHSEAKKYFDLAVREIPNDAEANAQYGIYLYRQKQYGDSLELLRRAVQLGPRHRQATYHLALCLRQLGMPEESARYMQRFRELQAKFEENERDAILERMHENLEEQHEQPKEPPPKDHGGD